MKNAVKILVQDVGLSEQLQAKLAPEFSIETGIQIPVILDMANFSKNLPLHDPSKSLVISHLPDLENIKLIQQHGLRHVLGQNSSVLPMEALTSLKKITGGKIWGMSPYFTEQDQIKEFKLTQSDETNAVVKNELAAFDFKEYFESPLEYIQVMANELITNSLYKGLNKKRVGSGLEPIDRYEKVHVSDKDAVSVTVAMNEHYVGLSVRDSFGTLDFATLVQFLKRGFEEQTVMNKRDGAGIGLYLTYMMSNQFIVNVKPGCMTEVICIIDKNKRHKTYKERISSFHYFEEENS